MSAAEYLVGWVVVAVVVGALAFGAWSLRAWLIPEWSGALARLAEAVAAIATLVLVAEVVGTVHLLYRGVIVAGVVIVCALYAFLGARARRRRTTEHGDPLLANGPTVGRRTHPVEVIAAVTGVALVLAQWAGKVAFALSNGMTHPDTLWYHGPYAALFAQRHHTLVHFDQRDALHAFANHTSELLHAVLFLLAGRDILSPLVNVGWFALALLAAWCLGQRFGAGAMCVLGAALVLGLPTVAATHPGQASNDIAAGALLLSAVALLVVANLSFYPSAFAAVAAGLAVSVKVTAAAPVAILTIGLIFIAINRKRWRVAAVWCGAVIVTGVYWFARNIRVAHNPLAYYDFNLGPIHLHGQIKHGGESVAHYITDAHEWRVFFIPGLRFGFGPAYPVVLGMALVGVVVGLVRRRGALMRVVAFAYLTGLVAYIFTPYTADNGGLSFQFNVRYVLPSLLGAVVLFALALATRRKVWRWIAVALMLGVIVTDLFARNQEHVPAWPRHALVAAPAAVVGVGVIVGVWYLLVKPRRVTWVRATAAVGILVVAAVAIGWPLQRHYFANRYEHAHELTDPIWAPFRTIRNSTVAAFGTVELYPYFGPDLSNKVEHPTVPGNPKLPANCRAWLQQLSHYRYIVIMHDAFSLEETPETALRNERNARQIAGIPGSAVFKVNGPLTGKGCR